MTSATKESWAVLISKLDFSEWQPLGKALSTYKKIPMQDAVHQARASWGIVEENLNEKAATELSRYLNEAGFVNLMIPQEKFAPVKSANLVNRIDLITEGLQIETKKVERRIIPWSYFCVAALSIMKKTNVRTIRIDEGPSVGERLAKTGIMLATGIPLPMKKKQTIEKKIEDTELFFFLDLFLKQNGLRIRLEARSLDYTFLKDKKGVGVDANFRFLVNEIGNCAKGALFNRGMRILLNKQPLNTAGYETSVDFEKECRWLLTLANIKE